MSLPTGSSLNIAYAIGSGRPSPLKLGWPPIRHATNAISLAIVMPQLLASTLLNID